MAEIIKESRWKVFIPGRKQIPCEQLEILKSNLKKMPNEDYLNPEEKLLLNSQIKPKTK